MSDPGRSAELSVLAVSTCDSCSLSDVVRVELEDCGVNDPQVVVATSISDANGETEAAKIVDVLDTAVNSELALLLPPEDLPRTAPPALPAPLMPPSSPAGTPPTFEAEVPSLQTPFVVESDGVETSCEPAESVLVPPPSPPTSEDRPSFVQGSWAALLGDDRGLRTDTVLVQGSKVVEALSVSSFDTPRTPADLQRDTSLSPSSRTAITATGESPSSGSEGPWGSWTAAVSGDRIGSGSHWTRLLADSRALVHSAQVPEIRVPTKHRATMQSTSLREQQTHKESWGKILGDDRGRRPVDEGPCMPRGPKEVPLFGDVPAKSDVAPQRTLRGAVLADDRAVTSPAPNEDSWGSWADVGVAIEPTDISLLSLARAGTLWRALWQGVIVRLDVHLDSPKLAELAFGAIVKQWGECVQCKDTGVVRLPISLDSWIATGWVTVQNPNGENVCIERDRRSRTWQALTDLAVHFDKEPDTAKVGTIRVNSFVTQAGPLVRSSGHVRLPIQMEDGWSPSVEVGWVTLDARAAIRDGIRGSRFFEKVKEDHGLVSREKTDVWNVPGAGQFKTETEPTSSVVVPEPVNTSSDTGSRRWRWRGKSTGETVHQNVHENVHQLTCDKERVVPPPPPPEPLQSLIPPPPPRASEPRALGPPPKHQGTERGAQPPHVAMPPTFEPFPAGCDFEGKRQQQSPLSKQSKPGAPPPPPFAPPKVSDRVHGPLSLNPSRVGAADATNSLGQALTLDATNDVRWCDWAPGQRPCLCIAECASAEVLRTHGCLERLIAPGAVLVSTLDHSDCQLVWNAYRGTRSERQVVVLARVVGGACHGSWAYGLGRDATLRQVAATAALAVVVQPEASEVKPLASLCRRSLPKEWVNK